MPRGVGGDQRAVQSASLGWRDLVFYGLGEHLFVQFFEPRRHAIAEVIPDRASGLIALQQPAHGQRFPRVTLPLRWAANASPHFIENRPQQNIWSIRQRALAWYDADNSLKSS